MLETNPTTPPIANPKTKPTPRQTTANRKNATKSTGPVTVAGKRKVSQNATKHGLLARSIVLEGEVLERFTALLDSLVALFTPRNCVEIALIENMAVARWRQIRLWGMEQAGMSDEMRKQALRHAAHDADGQLPNPDAPTRSALAFRAIGDNSRSLDIFNRYETRFERQYLRSLDRLERLRSRSDFSKQSQFSDGLPFEINGSSEKGTF